MVSRDVVLDAIPAAESHRKSRTRVGPPGLLSILITAAAILLALDTNSRMSWTGFFLTALVWLVLAGAWFLRLIAAVASGGWRLPPTEWVRWLVIPAALAVVFAITRTDAVFDARFSLSRGALDAMAADVMAGGAPGDGWVGLYNITEIERTANGFRFVIDDSGLGRVGFAYSPDGDPELSDDNFSPLWTGATFQPMGGPWWVWWEEWD